MKIPPVEAKLFHADGGEDMTKLIVAFGNFVNAPKSVKLQLHATSVNGITSNYKHLLET
jgi:hypothetical protein